MAVAVSAARAAKARVASEWAGPPGPTWVMGLGAVAAVPAGRVASVRRAAGRGRLPTTAAAARAAGRAGPEVGPEAGTAAVSATTTRTAVAGRVVVDRVGPAVGEAVAAGA